MQFKNIPNKKVLGKDGKLYWISRSVAVSVCVIRDFDGVHECLVIKRGPSVSHPGKLCLPCGFMDWNENGEEAALRELYEEAGITAPALFHWKTDTEPKSYGQNITLHYGNFSLDKLPEPTILDSGEVEDAFWLDLKEIPFQDKDNLWAFDHNKIAHEFYNFIQSY